ncbi:MAG: Rrf2 family transcriptional regulator, partial [Nitrospirota bacterium]
LLRAPSELSVADLLEALDGPVFHDASQNGTGQSRRDTREQLLLGSVWEKVHQAERGVLSAVTIDQLVDRQRELDQQQNPMYHI